MILNLHKWSDPYNPLVALTWPQVHLKISAMSSPFLCLLTPPIFKTLHQFLLIWICKSPIILTATSTIWQPLEKHTMKDKRWKFGRWSSWLEKLHLHFHCVDLLCFASNTQMSCVVMLRASASQAPPARNETWNSTIDLDKSPNDQPSFCPADSCYLTQKLCRTMKFGGRWRIAKEFWSWNVGA